MRKCTVCIPTFRRPENLNMLLSSILAMNSPKIAEVVVGITGSAEDSINEQTNQLRKAYKMLKLPLYIFDELTGICDAKKLFKEMLGEEIMLFCDDDTIFRADYLDLLSLFDSGEGSPEVGAVSGSLQTPLNVMGYKMWSENPIEIPDSLSKCNTLKVVDGKMDWSDKLQVYQCYCKSGKKPILSCEYLIGSCLFVRREALEIDMNFQNGACAGEEIDFTYNMFRKGYQVLFSPSRTAWHLHSMTGGNREKDRSVDDENMSYLIQKWNLGKEVKGETIYE